MRSKRSTAFTISLLSGKFLLVRLHLVSQMASFVENVVRGIWSDLFSFHLFLDERQLVNLKQFEKLLHLCIENVQFVIQDFTFRWSRQVS